MTNENLKDNFIIINLNIQNILKINDYKFYNYTIKLKKFLQ